MTAKADEAPAGENPGRGFNVIRALRRSFRASLGRRRFPRPSRGNRRQGRDPATSGAGGGFPAAQKSRARNQAFQCLAAGFPGDRRASAIPWPPRAGGQGRSCGVRRERRLPGGAEIPGAKSSISMSCGKFSGRSPGAAIHSTGRSGTGRFWNAPSGGGKPDGGGWVRARLHDPVDRLEPHVPLGSKSDKSAPRRACRLSWPRRNACGRNPGSWFGVPQDRAGAPLADPGARGDCSTQDGAVEGADDQLVALERSEAPVKGFERAGAEAASAENGM